MKKTTTKKATNKKTTNKRPTKATKARKARVAKHPLVGKIIIVNLCLDTTPLKAHEGLEDRSYSFLGVCESCKPGHVVLGPDSFTLRRWGTDAGIGQLVAGPRENTILDPFPPRREVSFLAGRFRSIAFEVFEVDQAAWAPSLAAKAKVMPSTSPVGGAS